MIRPSDITSMVASCFASTTGLRYGSTSTLYPSFTLEVTDATQPVSTSGSK